MALKTTHIVVQGDTLWDISQTYNTTVESIKELNNLTSDRISVGQVLIIRGERPTVPTNSNIVTIKTFGLLTGTTRTVLLTWAWGKPSQTEDYRVRWEYRIKDTNSDDWRFGQEGNVGASNIYETTYTADENAEAVRAWIEPIGKTYTVKQGDTEVEKQYKFNTTPWQYYNFSSNPPKTPTSAPTLSISKQTLTVTLRNIDLYETGSYTGDNKNRKRRLQFWVIKDIQNPTTDQEKKEQFNPANPNPYKDEFTTLISNNKTWTTTVDAGYEYYVRYRAWIDDQPGGWSPDSTPVASLPKKPEITKINVVSDKAIELTWKKINNAKSYLIEYASYLKVAESGLSKEAYFSAGQANKQSVSVEEDVIEKDGLTTTLGITEIEGSDYYIRVCSVNNKGDKSEWSEFESFSIGTKPSAPTTWSSTISAVVGDSLNLYWMHNSKDSSISNYAKLRMRIMEHDTVLVKEEEYPICVVSNDETLEHIQYEGMLDGDWLIRVNKSDPELKTDNTYVCQVNTLHDVFKAGYKIEWDVCTAGVKMVDGERVYGDYSMTRKVDIYSPPSFSSISLTDSNGQNIGVSTKPLLSFPLYVTAEVAMATNQNPITYYINVISQSTYETVDHLGNSKTVSAGSSVYSKNYNLSNNIFEEELNASNIDLENNITYKVVCTVSMSSGLKVTESREFKVSWIEEVPIPYADISINRQDVSAEITAYVEESSVDDILLSVYRKEADGTFVELCFDKESGTSVTDPHPALNYARYRIVAKQISTGGISYYDVPSYPVNEKSVVIQWNEPWQYLDKESYEIEDDRHSRSDSILKLPYNIQVSNNHSPDVSLVKYIGRERPVSYYGTQLGESATWSVAIPKTDTDTLYAIRRLARWMGNVYVREPSGSGYWANVKVSYSQKYNDLTIPITFNITPVEGGM